jgi:hypothetical protein
MGRVLEKILTQTQPMGDPTRGWVGFSGGFGAVYVQHFFEHVDYNKDVSKYVHICRALA